MENYDVITIGSATRNVYLLGISYDKHRDSHFKTGTGICFPWGSKVNVPEIFYATGGAGTNTAVTFARYGLTAAAVVRIGKDIRGDELINELKKERVGVSLVQIDPKHQTAYSIILLTKEGERTILAYRGAGESLNSKSVPWGSIRTKWVYLDSLHKNLGLLKGAIFLKQKTGAKIAWNPGGADLDFGLKKLKPMLKHVDIFIANQEEISGLFGLPYSQPEKIFKKYDELVGGIAVLTMGPKGVMVSDGKSFWQAGVFKERKIVDRTGAGDAFGSGFVASYMKKGDIEYAIRYASANATSKVESLSDKGGLLHKGDFEKEKRWKNLKIKKTVL